MFGFFKRRKLKQDAQLFEKKLIDKLSELFPDLAENYEHWALSSVYILEKGEKVIQLLHSSIDNQYVEKNRARHQKHFKIKGLEIFEKRKKQYQEFHLTVYANNIQLIHLPYENEFCKEFDLSSIRINNLTTEKLNFENPDKKALIEILKGLPNSQLNILEIEDTIEIDLEETFYYTIFDMEDGNYIAVDSKGKVFRLIHDHKYPVKKIAESVEKLFLTYSGDKKELEKYMNE